MGSKIQKIKRIATTAVLGTIGIPLGVLYGFGKIWTYVVKSKIKNDIGIGKLLDVFVVGPVLASVGAVPYGIYKSYETADRIAYDKIPIPKTNESPPGQETNRSEGYKPEDNFVASECKNLKRNTVNGEQNDNNRGLDMTNDALSSLTKAETGNSHNIGSHNPPGSAGDPIMVRKAIQNGTSYER